MMPTTELLTAAASNMAKKAYTIAFLDLAAAARAAPAAAVRVPFFSFKPIYTLSHRILWRQQRSTYMFK